MKPNQEGQGPNQIDQTLTSPEGNAKLGDAKLDSQPRTPPVADESSSPDSTALPACERERASSLAPTVTDDVASAPASLTASASASTPASLAVTQALANSDIEPTASPMDVDNADGAASPPAPTAVQNYQGNTVPMAVDNANGAAATTTTSVDSHQEQTVLVINNFEGTTSLPALTSAGSDPGTAVPMSVDQAEVPVDSIDTCNLPAWLTGNGMLDYLHGVSKESAWQNLVTSLLKFEMENKITGVRTSYFLFK